jgi:hypothetical protein
VGISIFRLPEDHLCSEVIGIDFAVFADDLRVIAIEFTVIADDLKVNANDFEVFADDL